MFVGLHITEQGTYQYGRYRILTCSGSWNRKDFVQLCTVPSKCTYLSFCRGCTAWWYCLSSLPERGENITWCSWELDNSSYSEFHGIKGGRSYWFSWKCISFCRLWTRVHAQPAAWYLFFSAVCFHRELALQLTFRRLQYITVGDEQLASRYGGRKRARIPPNETLGCGLRD